nr:MOSC N-terminal beta barrel domain-containing protein [Marinicella sp. NBU2979]
MLTTDTATITQLISYPIKSCAGLSHQTITANALGLPHDRQWMVVDANGRFLSQRQHPTMALIQPRMTAGTLRLSAPGMAEIEIPQTSEPTTLEVTVWKDTVQAHTTLDAVNQWLSSYLGSPVRLVHYGSDSFRQIDPAFAAPGQAVAFADGYPLLVTHEASLADLNGRLSAAVDMSRFRPNIVVQSAADAWSELGWQRLQNDPANSEAGHLDLVKPCARCVMTGINQQTGEQTGSEVLKTLRQQFAHQDQAVFGINGIAHSPQDQLPLQVGQSLQIVHKQAG